MDSAYEKKTGLDFSDDLYDQIFAYEEEAGGLEAMGRDGTGRFHITVMSDKKVRFHYT